MQGRWLSNHILVASVTGTCLCNLDPAHYFEPNFGWEVIWMGGHSHPTHYSKQNMGRVFLTASVSFIVAVITHPVKVTQGRSYLFWSQFWWQFVSVGKPQQLELETDSCITSTIRKRAVNTYQCSASPLTSWGPSPWKAQNGVTHLVRAALPPKLSRSESPSWALP